MRRGVKSLHVTLLLVVLHLSAVSLAAPQKPTGVPYALGAPLRLECLLPRSVAPSPSKEQTTEEDHQLIWQPGPMCSETNRSLELAYGKDAFFACSQRISQVQFDRIQRSGDGQVLFHCRVHMLQDATGAAAGGPEPVMPLLIPLWAHIEGDHVHVNNHINFVFHGDRGRVVGLSAYPLQDRFIYVAPGSIFSLHGNIKWFHQHSFLPFHAHGDPTGGDPWQIHILIAILAVMLVFVTTSICCCCLYFNWLKPDLEKEYFKRKIA